MRKIVFLLSLLLYPLASQAEINLAPLLNKVSLQLEASGFVTTQTALVEVGINAAVSDKGIELIQSDVMQQLNRLANHADWHIISYQRQQDSSGLERVQMIAQARLTQSDLSMLRTKAKAISKPGEQYTIDNVQFTPSEDEIRVFNANLRSQLYQQAKQEIEALNKLYPDQHYYLYQINFMSPSFAMPSARTMMMSAKVISEATSNAPPVGGLTKMQAVVELASMPEILSKQLTH